MFFQASDWTSARRKMSITAQKLLDVLRAAPEGLTTKEVSAKLGVGPYDAGGRLSKLAAYGKIERIKGKLPCEKAKWRLRQARDECHELSDMSRTPCSNKQI
jgi:hypothetical protein